MYGRISVMMYRMAMKIANFKSSVGKKLPLLGKDIMNPSMILMTMATVQIVNKVATVLIIFRCWSDLYGLPEYLK